MIAPELGKRFTLQGVTITVDHLAGGARELSPGTMTPMLWVEGHDKGQRYTGWIKRAEAWAERSGMVAQ